MELDAVFLSRLQFAFTIAFHIVFPAFTIGLSAWIATLLVVWRRTGLERYRDLARFWTRIFAVSFAMGVVSGIVLSYQFGTNWSRFSLVVGNVVGPLIGYEVLTAFFLEATFLGIMLFGWRRVPPGLHVLSAILVAAGTLFSAFWIISANSWMQDPAGHVMRDGIAYPADWLAAIFSPDLPDPLRPHGERGLSDDRLRRARDRRPLSGQRAATGTWPHHAEDGARHGGRAGAAPAPHRRRPRPLGGTRPAGQDRCGRGATGTAPSRARSSSSPFPTRRTRRTVSRSPFPASAASSSPTPSPAISRASRIFRPPTARRSRFPSSASA